MIRVWQITQHSREIIDLEDRSSLDAVTRQLPDGFYSTFRTYGDRTRVLGLKSHLKRLYDPVDYPDVSASDLRRNLIPILTSFQSDEARIRAIMTKQGQVYLAIEPLTPLPAEVYEKGVPVETTEIQRNKPRLKSTAFIGASASERKRVAQEGFFEALLVKNERVLEGMTSNFFYVRQPRAASTEELFTAQHGVLLGVTRKTIIHLARGRGVEVKYQALKLRDISEVNEAFITSSSRGVIPVVQIDQITVGQGRPGQITRLLISAYDDYVLKNAEKI